MGDKSPKSKLKDKNQKQVKATASETEKQRIISNKKKSETAFPGKKK